MKTLEQAFSSRQSVLREVESRAREVLEDFCKRRGFLLIGRRKTLDSLRDKLETGRYQDIDSVDDVIAFSVVIDTLGQETEVKSFIKRNFNVTSIKSGATLQDERLFDFDCTRICCSLDNKEGSTSKIFSVQIEVQIRTMLQHAWAKITHPQVYKAELFDARASRLAAEIMAQLESIDRSLSRFRTSSRSVKTVTRKEMTACAEIVDSIDKLVADGTIPSEMRPPNGRRLGENIFRSISVDKRKQYKKHLNQIKDFLVAQKEKFPRSVTLFQLAIVALHEANALEAGSPSRPRRYYVTDDLITLFPSAANIPNKIQLD